VKSGKYAELIKKIDPEVEVFSNACPLFVPLVENGYAESKAAELIAKDYLLPLKNEKVDTLILGCTHYPLLTKVISGIMGDEVTLLSPGALAAEEAKVYLEKENLLSDKNEGVSEFYVSDSVDNFAELGSTFLGKKINTNVHLAEVFE
jgi:glutamate racemase